jgi:hypothetical protein
VEDIKNLLSDEGSLHSKSLVVEWLDSGVSHREVGSSNRLGGWALANEKSREKRHGPFVTRLFASI